MEIRIMIQSTPNPNALKFVLNIPVKTEGKVTYKAASECENNPLAKAIFTVPNVKEVYFFDNYITVTQDGNIDWEDIEDQIQRIITENAESHDPNFKITEIQKPVVVSDNPDIAKINEILDRSVRPALQADGGDLQVMGFDGQIVSVNYQGACGSCPSSTMGTLNAIQGLLREEFKPDVVVEAV